MTTVTGPVAELRRIVDQVHWDDRGTKRGLDEKLRMARHKARLHGVWLVMPNGAQYRMTDPEPLFRKLEELTRAGNRRAVKILSKWAYAKGRLSLGLDAKIAIMTWELNPESAAAVKARIRRAQRAYLGQETLKAKNRTRGAKAREARAAEQERIEKHNAAVREKEAQS